MDKALLETDIFGAMLQGSDPTVMARATAYRATFGHYTIAALTVMELVQGFHTLGREDALQRFVAGLPTVEVVPLDMVSAALAGRIAADLARVGQPWGRAQPIMAATALRHRLTLVTSQGAVYRRIQALGYRVQLDDWHTSQSPAGAADKAE